MAPALPNKPPVWPVVAAAPPNRPPPAWGVLVPLAAGLEKENGEAVAPVAPPNRLPEAGAAVVVDWPEAALDAGVPNENDILATRCDRLGFSAAEQANAGKCARWDALTSTGPWERESCSCLGRVRASAARAQMGDSWGRGRIVEAIGSMPVGGTRSAKIKALDKKNKVVRSVCTLPLLSKVFGSAIP